MLVVTVEVWSSLSPFFVAPVAGALPRKLWLEKTIDQPLTLEELLRRLAGEYPRFASYMFHDGTGEPTDLVTVIINDRVPELLGGYQTVLKDGDRVTLVQAYAGG